MRSFSHRIGVLMMGFISALCFGSMAYASDVRPNLLTALRFTVDDLGFHGAESAKFQAEQTYMTSTDAVLCTVTGKLTRESNGYRLSELVNTASSEVAKGMTGVGASAALA